MRHTDTGRVKSERTALGGTLGGGGSGGCGFTGRPGVGTDTGCAISGKGSPNLAASVPGGASCEACSGPAVEQIRTPLITRTSAGQQATTPCRKTIDLLLRQRDGFSRNADANKAVRSAVRWVQRRAYMESNSRSASASGSSLHSLNQRVCRES
jgi:hypothetical protein